MPIRTRRKSKRTSKRTSKRKSKTNNGYSMVRRQNIKSRVVRRKKQGNVE